MGSEQSSEEQKQIAISNIIEHNKLQESERQLAGVADT